jgi:hypothetical protein
MSESKKASVFISPDVEDLEPVEPFHGDERRNDERHIISQHGSIRTSVGVSIVELTNLSRNGANVKFATDRTPQTNERVSLILFDNTTIDGRISWIDARHAGILFEAPLANVDDLLMFEHLGREYFINAFQLQKKAKAS